MTIFDGIFQGIIQGVTEFLPVSSSGHLSLYQHFTKNNGIGSLQFSVMLHGGTLLAIFLVYRRDIIQLVVEFFRCFEDIAKKRFSYKNATKSRKLLLLLIISTIPLIFFFPAKDFIEQLAQDDDIIVEGICFLITSTLLFFGASAVSKKQTSRNMPVLTSIKIGLSQVLALFPGVSRSGSTISTGLFCGLDKSFAIKFSFLMGIPAVLGGIIIDLKDMFSGEFTVAIWPLIFGFFFASVTGIVCIKLLHLIIRSDNLKVFAYYTLILGIATVAIGVFETF